MTEKVDDNYARAGFSQPLGFGKAPALLVIDWVTAYNDPASPLYAGAEAAVASTARILDAARTAGIPVLYTVVEVPATGAGGGLFARKNKGLAALAAGSPFGEICPEIAPLPSEPVISKVYASAFFGTNLATDLHVLGCDSVIITGVSTSGCVRASAIDAMQYGFIPLVVEDAVGDRHPDPHNASLFDLQAKYADVVSEHDVLAHLSDIAVRTPDAADV